MRYLVRLLGLQSGPNIPPPPPPDQWEQVELQQALRDLEVAESHFREASDPRAIDVAALRVKLAQARVLLALGRHDAPLDHPVPWLAEEPKGQERP